MRYFSTRYQGGVGQELSQNFSDILLGGLAVDGGLFLPECYPQITLAELDSWRALSYAQLAAKILRKFSDDIPLAEIEALCEKTYTAQTYCYGRDGQDAAQITPLHWLGEESGAPLGLLCLSNGPTLAFKDIAMQLLGGLFERALQKNNQQLNIIGATSGDTGSAAEYAMRDKERIRVFMLSPKGKMSPFQAAQMFSLHEQHIFNLAIEGVFDECQNIVKAVTGDVTFRSRYHLGVVNSINWARIVAQIVYYFKGYLMATTNSEQRISFTVPSGNFGNVCAGHIARMMGLPIAKLVVATNENDVLDRFFRTGLYQPRRSENVVHTSSPSMDISKASNFERFIADLFSRDGKKIAALFQQVEEKGQFDISATAEFACIQKYGFASGRSVHTDRLNTIRNIAERYDIMIDPHTADGIKVARENLQAGIPMLVLETALPTKFSEIIDAALAKKPFRPSIYKDIEARPQRYTVLPADVESVRHFIVNQLQHL